MLLLNLLILLALAAGHVELMVTAVNRLHGRPLPRFVLRLVRRVHDLLVPAFPVALVWCVGVRGPGLLVGGSWADLPVGWGVYLSLCAAGAVGLAVSACRWRRRAAPVLQASNDSETIDVAARLGYRPLAKGPKRYLAHVPGNEIFRVQVSEKVYRLPRLPAEWDGLSILHLSDLHFTGTLDRPFFDQIVELSAGLEADLIVLTGDLLDDMRLTEWLPETLGRLQAPLGRYYILGNHDWELDPPEIRRRMTGLGWTDVAGTAVTVPHRGRTLAIGGTEVPWMGGHPDLSQVPEEAFRLLLSHTPDNLAWAREQSVDLMLSGHNHGGQVVLPVVGPVYSPSRFGVRYAGGVFWCDPTLLYVSRGVSGKHPLRWNCQPEVTKLVLRPMGERAIVAQPSSAEQGCGMS